MNAVTKLKDVPKDIYDYVVDQEQAYAKPIDILGWEWSMADHIKTSFYYKHGRLLNGNDDNTPVKNIIKPILNMQYWAEDIDVKDLTLYIEDEDRYHLSFLVKKFHDDVVVKENDIDSLFDEISQSRIDMGGSLVMDVGQARPLRMELEAIAFCNQSDLLSAPIGFKYYLAPSELMLMKDRGWGEKENGATHSLEEVIALARSQNATENIGNLKQPNDIPGQYVQVYLIVGSLPKRYLPEYEDKDTEEYQYQMQVVSFYQAKDTDGRDMKKGITLFAKPCKNPFKFIKRDPVFGRALGFGGVEELFEPQAWTTYSEIQKKEIIDSASKILHLTDDEEFYKRNHNLKGVVNNEVLLMGENKTVRQMDTYPRSVGLMEKGINEWQEYAQVMGGAPNPLMGKESPAGTPFKLQDLVVQTGKNQHDWRQGQSAKFIEEIYRDWIIPWIVKEITKGQKFLSSLSLDEMEKVAESVVRYEANQMKKEMILSGQIVEDDMIAEFEQSVKESFMQDNNKFIEILKGELEDVKLSISINISNKQKNLSAMADKVSNIMKQALSTYDPNTKTFAIFDDPRMAKLLNQILEYSNMSMVDFNNYAPPKPAVAPALEPAVAQQQ